MEPFLAHGGSSQWFPKSEASQVSVAVDSLSVFEVDLSYYVLVAKLVAEVY